MKKYKSEYLVYTRVRVESNAPDDSTKGSIVAMAEMQENWKVLKIEERE